MEETFSRQQAAGTGRIYSESYMQIHKQAQHKTKADKTGSKMKTILTCILCLTFFPVLSVQTVSAQKETFQINALQTKTVPTEKLAAEKLQTESLPAETAAEEQSQQNKMVTFSQLNDREVFLKQSQARVCTLTSSAMMIRRAAMLSGNTNWRQITEQSVRKYAWAEKTGLKWNFTAAGITVVHKTLSSKDELIRMLGSHPEGVVIYNSRKPHAILVTDYTDGVFYCSDPSNDKPDGRYPIAQASITPESAGRCWYVKKPVNLTVDMSDAGAQSAQLADGLLYRVLDEEKKTVVCTGRALADTSVTVPETVTLNGVEYQVVQIAEGAFADSDSLKEITIGANVAAIEPKAFYQCKKLQKVTIYASGLQKIGADAFAKIHKKAKILIIGEPVEEFAALLTGTSVPVTATVGAGQK